MKKIAIGIMATALMASLMPAHADPLEQRDMVKVLTQAPKRYLPSEPGKKEQLTLLFGPYTVPPGQDTNRILADVALPAGFMKSVAPDLVDAASGRVPTEQEAHIHHAHWFRVTDDPDELYYTNLGNPRGALPDFVPEEVRAMVPDRFGLSWVFGTGEEKTQGGFYPREDLEDFNGDGVPDRQYGMEIKAGQRQVLIFMIHNKTAAPLNAYVVLDVDFMHGTAEEILDATRIPMHPVKGQLWGRTQNATRSNPALISTYNAELTSTAIVTGGHAHPGVYENVMTNTGPSGSCRGTDLDGDGYPGVTLLRARKIDHVPGSWPYSEDFQMGVAKYGWRAPIRAGDRLEQQAFYDIDNDGIDADRFALPGNAADLGYPTAAALDGEDTVSGGSHQHYQAMNHYGMYFDPLQPPEGEYLSHIDPNDQGLGTRPWQSGDPCPINFLELASPTLYGEDVPTVQQRLKADKVGIAPYFAEGVTEGMQNHTWAGLDPTCGDFEHATRPVCENGPDPEANAPGMATDTIHIAGFQYLPGGSGLAGALGAPAVVTKGTTLQIVNEDVVGNIRHTLTSCPWPCTGTYVSNFPFPDGRIDTGKLGNIDPIETSPGAYGGFIIPPVYDLNTTNMEPGLYSFYCRIHPFMRGSFEVVMA